MALAVGAGAILQVVIEVSLLLGRQAAGRGWASAPAMAGAALGLAVMYTTALLIPA
jgi:hypothetical protein